MPTRTYTRPDGATGTHVLSLSITVWSDGTFTGAVSAWEPGGERMRHYRLPGGVTDGTVAPRGLEALQQGAQLALDLWGEGALR